MDLIKVYIIQSISAASNNLRLNSQKVEVVALLREMISKSENLGEDLFKMKRVTEFSKIGIRLNELYIFLTTGKIDFFRISERFKEHSQYLIRDLSQLLDSLSPEEFKAALKKMNAEKEIPEEIKIDLSKRGHNPSELIIDESHVQQDHIVADKNHNDVDSFHNYEKNILSMIKPLENMLSGLQNNNINNSEIENFVVTMQKNAHLSYQKRFEVIGNMHSILSHALDNIVSGKLIPEKSVIDSMRACMIVIVALIRGKEVDIGSYLNKAEEFGKRLIH